MTNNGHAPVRLLAPETCTVCWHPDHRGDLCHANDDEWLDPQVGGDPNNEPRECGCTEYVSEEMRGRIVVVIDQGIDK